MLEGARATGKVGERGTSIRPAGAILRVRSSSEPHAPLHAGLWVVVGEVGVPPRPELHRRAPLDERAHETKACEAVPVGEDNAAGQGEDVGEGEENQISHVLKNPFGSEWTK